MNPVTNPAGIGASPVSADLRKIGSHPDHWYPLAWSHEVNRGSAFASSFAGEPIVIVRADNGDLFALEDRCAHRWVPLSKGVVRDCHLHCCYHGRSYDSSGRCGSLRRRSLSRQGLPNGVRAYPCCELDGVVLVWPGHLPPSRCPRRLAPPRIAPTRRDGSDGSSIAITLSCTRT
ncbi:Rieske 2Fe-2S domain-containing protein [Bradyrhizobium sp. UFLA05-112]